MEPEQLREEWNKAERDLAGATHPPDIEELTKRAEERYEEYMRAKEADSIARRVAGSTSSAPSRSAGRVATEQRLEGPAPE